MTVNEVVNCGGIAEKNPLVMQIYADVCNRPMKISRSAQTCALGAAIFGAVVGGAHAVGRGGPSGDDRRQADRLPADRRERRRLRASCTSSTARCTTPSATDGLLRFAARRDEGPDRHPQRSARGKREPHARRTERAGLPGQSRPGRARAGDAHLGQRQRPRPTIGEHCGHQAQRRGVRPACDPSRWWW